MFLTILGWLSFYDSSEALLRCREMPLLESIVIGVLLMAVFHAGVMMVKAYFE